MALILATGLVVDDAIVVLENISRHIENGEPPMRAAFLGAKEVGFTLLSMNVSLVAVFVPILFMGGIVRSLFQEFSITLAAAIIVSLVVSLTLTPMLCARWLKPQRAEPTRLQRWSDHLHQRMVGVYDTSLGWALRHKRLTLLSLLATIGLNIALYVVVPKTLMPQQDTGQLMGFIRGDDGLSFSVMQPKMEIYRRALLADRAVQSVAGFIGGNSGTNNAMVLVRLKPISERKLDAQKVIERLRRDLPKVPGGRLFLMADQDLQLGGGGRDQTSSQYLYTLQSGDLAALREWFPKVVAAMRALPELTAIDARDGSGTQQVTLVVDRDQAKRLGIDMDMVTTVLNNAYSQRQISTIYDSLNQYQVVLEINPKYAWDPSTLEQVQVITSDGARVPLSTIAHYQNSLANDRVSHEGQFASEDIAFDVAEGYSTDQAIAAVERAVAKVGLPEEVIARLGGTANAFAKTQEGQPFMILGALVLVYLVLGILYESYIHPLTILSTLPSAGVGALLALYVTGGEFSLISLLGLFLLIGVVKKNAILMIDLALQLERHQA